MIIRVLDQNYFVQQTLPSEKGLVQYVCTNVSEDDGRIYRLVRIPLREVQPELVRYLADIYREGLFHGLVQYGNETDHFIVVVDCGPAKARSLKDRVGNDVISLQERLTMGEKLLKHLILSSVPVGFAESAMDTDHVFFTDALDCSLVFEMESLEGFAGADKDSMLKKLSKVLGEVFEKELTAQKLPEMKAFLERVSEGEYPGVLGVYHAYRKLEQQLAGIDEKELEPKSLPWRIWEKIKAFAKFLTKCVWVLVILIAVAYLVWSIRNAMKPTQAQDIYQAIGDERILSGTRTYEEAGAELSAGDNGESAPDESGSGSESRGGAAANGKGDNGK